jgi:PadR family transcriptional regulator PadR
MYTNNVDDNSQLKKGSTSFLILLVLSRGKKHGYAIARDIEATSQNALSMGEGALYPALRALERQGFIVSEWQPQLSSPQRRVYSLTDQGEQRLRKQIADWDAFSNGVTAVLRAAHANF